MITDKELAVQIPTAFKELFPDAWKHDIDCEIVGTKCCDKCKKCGKHAEPVKYSDKDGNTIIEDIYWERSAIFNKTLCTVPDPVNIKDWNIAHKVFRAAWMERGWAVMKVEITKIMKSRHISENPDVYEWWTFTADAADYLRVALLAKENE